MDVPELTNFGSLIRYALELEESASSLYDAIAARSSWPGLSAAAKDLAAQHRERRREVERARQRFLNEVILEPITTLDGRTYVVDGSLPDAADAAGRACDLEETSRRFYADAADVARSMLAEAVRIFRRLADTNAQNAARVRGIAPP